MAQFEAARTDDVTPCQFAAHAVALIAADVSKDLVVDMREAPDVWEAGELLRDWLRAMAYEVLVGHVLGGTSDHDCNEHLEDRGKF